jgi:hypothetical protein
LVNIKKAKRILNLETESTKAGKCILVFLKRLDRNDMNFVLYDNKRSAQMFTPG